jgi:hypothetical protein
MSAQRQFGLLVHGRPDPATLVKMGYYDPIAEMPASQAKYARGGDKPGTFFRDLQGVSNQVPWYVWTLAGVGTMGFAYYLYRRGAKGKK